jgi:hypothetical protein
MRQREDSELMAAFCRHWHAGGRDLDAALRAVHEMGVRDGVGKRRRKSRAPGIAVTDEKQEQIMRVMPFIRRIARAMRLSPVLLICGTDLFTARRRQEAFVVLRELSTEEFSYPVIAGAFGKDHSTVIDGCHEVEKRIAGDAELGRRLREIAHRIAPRERRVGAAA